MERPWHLLRSVARAVRHFMVLQFLRSETSMFYYVAFCKEKAKGVGECDRGNSCYFTCEHFSFIFAYNRKGSSAASRMTICRTTILHSTKEGWGAMLSSWPVCSSCAVDPIIVMTCHLLAFRMISLQFSPACCGRRPFFMNEVESALRFVVPRHIALNC